MAEIECDAIDLFCDKRRRTQTAIQEIGPRSRTRKRKGFLLYFMLLCFYVCIHVLFVF